MTASIVMLHPDGQKLTGTGTATVTEQRVAGYLNTDGTNDATVVLKDGDASGGIIFEWTSPVATAIWPTVCPSKEVYYEVSGSGAFVMLHTVVV